MRKRAGREIRDEARRWATVSSLAQAGAAAAIGAFFASFTDPADGVRWALLGLAIGLAALAAVAARRAGG